MTVLTAEPTLKFLLTRLRASVVLPSLFSDDDVLTMLNDAYLEVCEETGCLRSVFTQELVEGQQEYPLPSDFSGALYVCAVGQQLDPISPVQSSAPGFNADWFGTGYYVWGSVLGVAPLAQNDALVGKLLMLYTASPSPLASWTDDLDARYPIEFADLLVLHVRWRVRMISGGAEAIQSAQLDRQMYAARLKELRRTVETVDSVGPFRMIHAGDRRRTRVVN